MRLLGKCPNCGNEDSIFTFWRETGDSTEYNKVRCSNCKTVWKDWFDLIRQENVKGNKLIPVEIQRLRDESTSREDGIQLLWPLRENIYWDDMIIMALNTALIIRFSNPNNKLTDKFSRWNNELDVCLSSEGGVRGWYKGRLIELRNTLYNLGLYVTRDSQQGEGLKRILDFYHLMLQYLFEVGPESIGGQYRRGEILRLSKDEKDFERARTILISMLTRVKNKQFAEKVVDTMIRR